MDDVDGKHDKMILDAIDNAKSVPAGRVDGHCQVEDPDRRESRSGAVGRRRRDPGGTIRTGQLAAAGEVAPPKPDISQLNCQRPSSAGLNGIRLFRRPGGKIMAGRWRSTRPCSPVMATAPFSTSAPGGSIRSRRLVDSASLIIDFATATAAMIRASTL